MTLERSKPPGNLSNLERWLQEWADADNVTAGRIRRRVSVLVASAILDRIRDAGGDHLFVAKGGAALEMRFGARARTSKDFDSVYRGPIDEVVDKVKDALEDEWHGFTGRINRISRIEGPGLAVKPVRFELKLAYRGKPFATIPMEVGAPEGDALATVDTVEVTLIPVGLPAPPPVPCLSVRYQIAQKLHACTDPLDDEQPNDRAHDLADLILLEELLHDELADVRAACIDIFTGRDKQPWPPVLVDPGHWVGLWAAIVEEDDFFVTDLEDALDRVRRLIGRVNGA